MTGFDILLCCLILFIISLIIAIKCVYSKPTDFTDWLVIGEIAILIMIVIGFVFFILYVLCTNIYYACYDVNWKESINNFFTQKVI